MAPVLALSTTSFNRSFSLASPTISAGRNGALSSARFKQHHPSFLCNCRGQLPSFCEAQRKQVLTEHLLALASSKTQSDIVFTLLQHSQKFFATSLGASLLLATLPAIAYEASPEHIEAVFDAIILWLSTAVLYFLVAPLGIHYYLYKRWFKRKMAEAIFQLFLVFLFFPGLLLWAPFINFRGAPKEGAKEPWDEIRP